MPHLKAEGTWAEEKVPLPSEAEPGSQYPEQLLWIPNRGAIYYNQPDVLLTPSEEARKGREKRQKRLMKIRSKEERM